jgi:hypothetical protein
MHMALVDCCKVNLLAKLEYFHLVISISSVPLAFRAFSPPVPIVCLWFLVAMSTALGSPFPIKLISGLAVFAIDRESAAIMMSICGDVDLTAPAASGAAGGGSGTGSMASASSVLDNTGFSSDSRFPLVAAAAEKATGAAGGSGSGTDRGSPMAAESSGCGRRQCCWIKRRCSGSR